MRETKVQRATVSPSTFDIYKAAGWWAGEGSVCATNNHLTVSVAQKEVEVLLWLQSRFGGSVHMRKKAALPHLTPVNAWTLHGHRARGFLQTIYSCLPESPRRQAQIYGALKSTMEIKKTGIKPSAFCRRGHSKQLGRECRTCANDAAKKRRLNPEVADKHRKEERRSESTRLNSSHAP